MNGLKENSPITAETSLKRLLRENYQHPQIGVDTDLHDQKRSVNESRGRLSILILGTSVMRLRHWYAVVTREGFSPHGCAKHIMPYPLDPSLLSLVNTQNNTTDIDHLNISKSETYSHIFEETSLVRAMVDEHASYLLSSSYYTLPSLPSHLLLSIQYSVPPFLTSSLLSQYGYTRAREICRLMNIPGPITLRRNVIRFPGSDIELCKWLWEEDGINATSCNDLHPRQTSKLLITASSHDGSNIYVVGSSDVSGSIMAPDGAIRIIPPKFINTTIAEQRRSIKSIWSMRGWQNGYFEVQDAGSQVISQSLEVSPGESILDYCAGNGGKTFALASAVLNTSPALVDYSDGVCNVGTKPIINHSKIVSHDVIDERLRQIKGSLKRVGFESHGDKSHENDTVYVARNRHGDSKCTIQIATSSVLEAGVNCLASSFDAVLVDAPCSSTGVLRRRPSQRWELKQKQAYEELPQLQLEILKKAASFVREGGRLVYSTCSLLEEENACVAEKFEQSIVGRGFKRWDFTPTMGGVSIAKDVNIDYKTLSDEQSSHHTLTILPSKNGSDGFFIARWKRCKK
jgi:16S rRNA C967 or C1407 C5-methylase (RsmB/RsmF family)